MHIATGMAQANVKFSGAAIPNGAECTFGVSLEDAGLSPADVADLISDLWSSTIGTQQTSQVGVQSVLVKFGPNDTGPFAEVAGGGSSGVGSTSTAPNFSVLVQKKTAFGGRTGSGRMFVPGIAESVVGGNGIVDPSAIGGYQAAADDLLEGLAAADIPMVLLHQAVLPLAQTVTSLVVQGVGATQRRRQRR